MSWLKSASVVPLDTERTYSAVRAVFGLVQRSHTQTADMARLVIAWRNGVKLDGLCADEAHLAVGASSIVGICCGAGNRLGLRLRGSLRRACILGLGSGTSIVASSTTTAPLSASAARSSITSTTTPAAAASATVAIAPRGVRGFSRHLGVRHGDRRCLVTCSG